MEEMREKRRKEILVGCEKKNKGYQSQAKLLRDKENNLIGDEMRRLERWAEHFENICKDESIEEDAPVYTIGNYESIEPPTYDVVEQVIAKMKNNRASEEDSLVIELFEYGGKSLINKLHRLICYIWEEEVMPEDWNMGLILSLIHI